MFRSEIANYFIKIYAVANDGYPKTEYTLQHQHCYNVSVFAIPFSIIAFTFHNSLYSLPPSSFVHAIICL